MSSLTSGLDVHKDWSDATVRRDSDGHIVAGKRRLPNELLLDFLSEYHGIERIAIEASTSIVPVHRALRERGYDVMVSHPKKTRLIAESMIETDRVDSEALSELARLNALPLSYIPEPDVARLTEKVRLGLAVWHHVEPDVTIWKVFLPAMGRTFYGFPPLSGRGPR